MRMCACVVMCAFWRCVREHGAVSEKWGCSSWVIRQHRDRVSRPTTQSTHHGVLLEPLLHLESVRVLCNLVVAVLALVCSRPHGGGRAAPEETRCYNQLVIHAGLFSTTTMVNHSNSRMNVVSSSSSSFVAVVDSVDFGVSIRWHPAHPLKLRK